MERLQKKLIIKDLNKKIVLLSGPRQSGKTTLAKQIAKEFKSSIYLNYDNSEDRRIIHDKNWLISTELIIFDEIHKMTKWKNYLKGLYDTKNENQKILVTGSARLEVFNQVGDSLAGRFFLHRLMPFSPAELDKMNINVNIDRFLERGSFPEPFLTKDFIDSKRWRLQYIDALLREDIFDFENINNLKAIRLVFELLRNNVGSPISYQSISEDVSISPNTVKKYINIFEALYIIFRVVPYSKNIGRSILKQPKIYFFDVGLVKGDEGKAFENFVGLCLLKHVFANIDYKAENYSLKFLYTKEKKEVDFALVKDGKVEKIFEVKMSDRKISDGLKYFHKKYNLPAYQIIKNLRHEKIVDDIYVYKADKFLKNLDL